MTMPFDQSPQPQQNIGSQHVTWFGQSGHMWHAATDFWMRAAKMLHALLERSITINAGLAS